MRPKLNWTHPSSSERKSKVSSHHLSVSSSFVLSFCPFHTRRGLRHLSCFVVSLFIDTCRSSIPSTSNTDRNRRAFIRTTTLCIREMLQTVLCLLYHFFLLRFFCCCRFISFRVVFWLVEWCVVGSRCEFSFRIRSDQIHTGKRMPKTRREETRPPNTLDTQYQHIHTETRRLGLRPYTHKTSYYSPAAISSSLQLVSSLASIRRSVVKEKAPNHPSHPIDSTRTNQAN